jgi:2-polyprenyl-3-methyl-5-hydroxy-6-metoxy-1,4-benzoquinol methylase
VTAEFDIDETVAGVATFFDGIGMAEWDRHDENAAARVAFELHRRMLRRHVRSGARVLEVGAGPGRFTLELAALQASVTVADISEVQLRLNEQTVRDAGVAEAVRAWVRCDIRDLSRFTPGEFDAVVAYGGPISYTFEDAEQVTAGLLGLLPPGGVFLSSLMSLLGAWRMYAPHLVSQVAAGALTFDDIDVVLRTADTRHDPSVRHKCRCFRADEVAAMVHAGGGEVLELSASGWAAFQAPESVASLLDDPARREWFLDWEERFSASPGALDGGAHILVAARRA